jgi:replicative DNA helicase
MAKDDNDLAVAGRLPEDPKDGCSVVVKGPRLLTVQQLLDGSVKRTMSPRDARERCTTGIRKLDNLTGALRRGFVWVLGAETSWAKSSFAIALADDNLQRGKKVLICSAEDRETVYADRLMCRRARVSAARLRDGKLTAEELSRATNTLAKAEPTPVYLDAIGLPEVELCRQIGVCCREYEIDLVIVDYLQSIPASKRYQDQRVRFTETALKIGHTTKSLDVPLLLLSQITPSDREELTKYSIRESKDVPNAAEVVLLGLEQKEDYVRKDRSTVKAGTKILKVDKAKDGERGKVELNWNSLAACFVPEGEEHKWRVENDQFVETVYDEFDSWFQTGADYQEMGREL